LKTELTKSIESSAALLTWRYQTDLSQSVEVDGVGPDLPSFSLESEELHSRVDHEGGRWS